MNAGTPDNCQVGIKAAVASLKLKSGWCDKDARVLSLRTPEKLNTPKVSGLRKLVVSPPLTSPVVKKTPIKPQQASPVVNLPAKAQPPQGKEKDTVAQIKLKRQVWSAERDNLEREIHGLRKQVRAKSSEKGPPIPILEFPKVVGDPPAADIALSSSSEQLESLRREIARLKSSSRKEISKLRCKLEKSEEVSREALAMRDEILSLRATSSRQIELLRLELFQVKMAASVADSLKNKKDASETPKNLHLTNAPETPKKKAKVTFALPSPPVSPLLRSPSSVIDPPGIASPRKEMEPAPSSWTVPWPRRPRSIDDLAHAQRHDKTLKAYLLNESVDDTDNDSGVEKLSYDISSMTIREVQGSKNETKYIVLFDNRVYIPAKLRTKLIHSLVDQYLVTDALKVLPQHYIWPGCVKELADFLNSDECPAAEL